MEQCLGLKFLLPLKEKTPKVSFAAIMVVFWPVKIILTLDFLKSCLFIGPFVRSFIHSFLRPSVHPSHNELYMHVLSPDVDFTELREKVKLCGKKFYHPIRCLLLLLLINDQGFFFSFFFLWYPNFGPKNSKFSKIYTRETEISKKSSIFGLKKQQILSEIKSLIMNLSICLFLAKFWHLGTNKRDLPNLWKNPPYFKGKKNWISLVFPVPCMSPVHWRGF